MSTMKVKGKVALAIVIMRGHIFHNGHAFLIDEACKIADNVLILIGSINRSRSMANPFSFEERESMMRPALSGTKAFKCQIKPLNDYLYVEYDWESEVQRIAHDHAQHLGVPDDIAIVGHLKDNTSYYLRGFPRWKKHHVDNLAGISATPLREAYFQSFTTHFDLVKSDIPEATQEFLWEFRKTDEYKWLCEQQRSVEEYKADYKDLPHGVNFITGDALVICHGHILLIKRKDFPGKDQWALPGGFKNPGEYARDCILRELDEETCISVPPRVLEQAYRGKKMFEDPKRDDRGDFTTHVGSFILTDSKLPKVKGADDAKEARWFPFAQVRRMSKALYADHYFIIQNMLSSGYGTGFTGQN